MNRRSFLRATGIGAVGLGIHPHLQALPFAKQTVRNALETPSAKNKLPRWRGFNFLDFFAPVNASHENVVPRGRTTQEELTWMRDWGFDFVRIPMAYPSYLEYNPKTAGRHILPEEVVQFDEAALERVDRLVTMANDLGHHVSLCLHRAPGFCINAGFHEPYNLWRDQQAQEALYTHWAMWAKRYQHISSRLLSFDLLNEPCAPEDMNNQFSKKPPVEGTVYRNVAKGCMEAIRPYNNDRIIVADGNGGGHSVTPELIELGIAQSCRGYSPFQISHHRAPWVYKEPDKAPAVCWPGEIEGKRYDRSYLEEFYKPWTELIRQGIGVHCGEFGCYKETPHTVFLAWFEDLLSVLKENEIGWGLWEFRGDFGILNSNRRDVNYTDWHGMKLDKELLALLQMY